LTRRKAIPYLFISPWYLLFLTFVALPLCHSIWLSMQDMVGLKSRVFVGAANYMALPHDPLYGKALWNTAYFALGTLFLQLPLALILALALNSQKLRGKVFFRLAFFSPVLIAGVFIAIIFGLVFNSEYGLVNYILGSLGFNVSGLRWLQDSTLIMPAIIFAGVWRWSGFNMVYFLAGLQAIRQELYEAASIDGAGAVQSFLNVTLPGLRPMLAFVLVMSMIGSLQLFDLPYILLQGSGPNDAGLTAVMYLYRQGFQYGRLGYAAAIGWSLFGIIFIVSMVQMKFLGKPVEQ
jgi:ABC-type sugar transport system permease subunit